MNSGRVYSASEVERVMKLQDVLLKAMAKKITWWAAAEIIGASDRTMRRWRERFEENGYDGLMDQRKGKPPAGSDVAASGARVCGFAPGGSFPVRFSKPRTGQHGLSSFNAGFLVIEYVIYITSTPTRLGRCGALPEIHKIPADRQIVIDPSRRGRARVSCAIPLPEPPKP